MKISVLIVALLFALPLHAEPVSLSKISAYLNSIKSAKSSFTQINGDGSSSSGTLYIKRPGRARFEYNPPMQDTLVLASGGQVAIFDGRASGKPEQYPLSRTPLNLILARKIDFNRARMVTGHGEENGRTIVQAQDPAHPEYGKIYLYFNVNPLRLSEWLIVSGTGEKTRVKLNQLVADNSMSPFLFDIKYQTDKRR